MIQWDGSPHPWFGKRHPPCCLLAAVDDATTTLLAALFTPAESSEGYLRLLEEVLGTHGIPMAIYHDQHSSLVRTDGHWSLQEQMQGRQFPTHVGRVLEEMGIESIPATSPQAKGRIERTFGTLQDRLMPELRLANIASIQSANAWLTADFIPRYIELLAHGGSARPEEILAAADVDITDPEFWRGGFAVVAQLVDELERLETG